MEKDPRITLKRFHKEHSLYKAPNATARAFHTAIDKKIISKPELYCNCGFAVKLHKNNDNQLEVLHELSNNPRITYAVALCGDYSLITFELGASDLKYADRITPTFPARNKVENLVPVDVGRIECDPYPHGWDDIDWEVYYLMKDPSKSFSKAAENSDLSWITVKKHYCKIIKDCRVHTSFFPKGYGGYSRAFLTFKTKYEIGFINALQKIDRTTYLWKVRDLIILILFVDHYNKSIKRFKQLEEVGLIHDLKVSIPTRYYTPHDTVWDD